MLSSIFNSSSAAAKSIVHLLALLALLGAGAEVLGTAGYARVSHSHARIIREYREVSRLRPVSPQGWPTVLLLGNSLLKEGVDMPALQTRMAGHYSVTRLAVEQTQYWDWYFGLRRLYREGSRPANVVLVLSTLDLFSEVTRGEYFGRFLMDGRDITRVATEIKLDRTAAATLSFAHWSGWLSSRVEIRNFLLMRLMPNFEQLVYVLPSAVPPLPAEPIVQPRLAARLRQINQICLQYGTHLVIVIPTTQDPNDRSRAAISAGHLVGVPVLSPYQPGEMPADDYAADGLHANPRGASLFTVRLAPLLDQTLGQASAIQTATRITQ